MENTPQYGNQPSTTQTKGFGEIVVSGTNEKAAIATAEAAKAEIQAAYIMAMKNRRDDLQVRDSLMKVCKNPYFAESAIYRKPVGKKQGASGKWVQNFIEGLSIRFAEEYMRLAGNMRANAKTIYEDNEVIISVIGVLDLETNMGYSKEIKICKTVERKSAHSRTVVSERLNSHGERVFIVEATDDELRNKLGSETSKFIRDAALRLCPAHIKQEAEEIIRATIAGKIQDNPESAKRKLVDAFSAIGISPAELKKYIGNIDTLSTSQIQQLRADYTALKDGHTTWSELIELEKDRDNEKPKPQRGSISKLKAGDISSHVDVKEPLATKIQFENIRDKITLAKDEEDISAVMDEVLDCIKNKTITLDQQKKIDELIAEKTKKINA